MVFIRNDPMFVESIHLPDFVTKRKPDVVLVEIESGKKWLGVEASGTFQQCKEEAGKVKTKGKGKKKGKGMPTAVGKGKAGVKQKEKCGWMPIAQFWEFKMLKKLKDLSARLGSPYDMNSLTPSGAPAGESFIHMSFTSS